jgi:hypothetical protein
MCGARVPTEIHTRGCHWFPRVLASTARVKRAGVGPMTFLSGFHSSYRFTLQFASKH